MTTILIIEDEESYREPLAFALRKEGFTVITAANGQAGLAKFSRNEVDLILLDLMMPDLDGMEVCRQVRATSSVPIIMVTAKDEVIDRIIGLEFGADDYLAKPYSFRELLARVRAVLRRTSALADFDEQIVQVGSVILDPIKHLVSVAGQVVAMPLREFELLELLMRHPDRVLTRGQIIDRVWGSDYVGDTKTLDVHIKRLRSRVEADPANPNLIITVRGLGYKVVSPR